METCASDISSECLVTDLVHELSSGLEIPFLLGEDIKAIQKQENVSHLANSTFYDESLKEDWPDDIFFNFTNNCESNFHLKNEISDDLRSYLDKSDFNRTHSTMGLSGSGSGSGSGSECSSTEIWMTKNELDTPPTTPPDERTSPENTFLLSRDESRFMPIRTNGSNLKERNEKSVTFKTGKVRIQPKPFSTTLNIFDSQLQTIQTVMCNVFNDVNSNNIKNNKNGLLESNILASASVDRKKTVLSKKDLELLQLKRKQERMIRNRESAYLSRKRKKEHVAQLEKQVQDLLTENEKLRMENFSLRQRLAKYVEVNPLPSGKKPRNIFTESPRKTTALLALLFTVCLNIGSFSSFINEKRFDENDIAEENPVFGHSSEMRHTRSLLWAHADFESLNATYGNSTKTSCPVYINQTESIRLESELRRWIGGDDDYSRPSKRNISKLSQFFYSGDKPPRRKSASKRKQGSRTRSLKGRTRKLEVDMYQMKSNLFKFDTFFEAIHRRDDTFYLVSFSSDHLLLPALSHNKTSRPKMSLMLPAFASNGTGADQVEMMRIDCEVTNTQLLSVNENDIPSHMRPYSNTTSRVKNANETKSEKFEELFMKNLPDSLASSENDVIENHSVAPITKSNGSGNFKLTMMQNRKNGFDSFKNKIAAEKKTVDDFSNETYKHEHSSVDFSLPGKTLLKLLMVGPPATSSKAIEFSSGKSSEKSFKNATKTSFD